MKTFLGMFKSKYISLTHRGRYKTSNEFSMVGSLLTVYKMYFTLNDLFIFIIKKQKYGSM